MLTFAKTLNDCIEESGFSQKMIADMCNCSRTMIYAILNNKKPMSESMFQALAREVPFTENQKKRLRVAFYSDKYPPGIVSKIDLINKRFSQPPVISFDLTQVQDYTASPDDTVILTRRKLKMEISALLNELASSFEDASFITNYPFTEKELDDTVYETLRGLDKHIDFRHIVRKDSRGKTDTNVSMIFDSLRYIKLRYTPLVFNSTISNDDESDSLYDYYAVADNFLILFNIDATDGILIRSPKLIQAALHQAKLLSESCTPLAVMPENYLQLREVLEQSSKLSLQYTLDNYACVGSFADEDIFDALARPDLPNRDLLIKLALHHYSPVRQMSPFPRFYTAQGLRHFAFTGNVQEFPAEWTVPLPIAVRQKLLRKYIEILSEEPQNLFILNDNLLRFASDERFSIELYPSRMSILGSISEESKSYLGEYVIFFEDDSITAPFKAYLDFIIRNNLYYSRDYSIHFINDLIYECENFPVEVNNLNSD